MGVISLHYQKTLRVMTLEFKLISPLSQPTLNGFCFNTGHFEAFKKGVTGVISDLNHQLMTFDSDSLLKNLRNELRVKKRHLNHNKASLSHKGENKRNWARFTGWSIWSRTSFC